MTISISDALQHPLLNNSQLIAGYSGIDRKIHHVEVLDLSLLPTLVNEEELILIPSTMDWKPEQLLAHLSDYHNPVGLVVSTMNELEALVPICDELKLPLVQLNSMTSMKTIKEELMLHIRQTNYQAAILKKQKSLLELVMKNKQSSALFTQISNCLSYPIAVLNSKGQLLYNNSNYSIDKLMELLPHSSISKAAANNIQCNILALPCQTFELGYLLIFHHLDVVHPQEELLFFQAANMIATHIQPFYSSQLTLESYLAHMWLYKRLAEHNNEGYELLPPSNLFQNISSLFCFVTTSISNEDATENALYQVAQIIEGLCSKYHYQFAHIAINEGLTTLVYSNHPMTDSNIEQQWLQDIRYELGSSVIRQAKLQVALSKQKFHLNELTDAFNESRQSLQLSRLLQLQLPVVTFAELEFNHVLQHIPSTIRTQFSTSLLQPLLNKDEHYKNDMLKTLDAYIEHEGSVTKTAKALFIHRNTVLYRIDKASELLGMDFKKLSHLMQLKIALVFYKLTAPPST